MENISKYVAVALASGLAGAGLGTVFGVWILSDFWLAIAPFDTDKVSAYSTLFAAIGTVGALCYALWQGNRNGKEQRRLEEKHDAAQERQNTLWEEQKKLIAFQRYQGHKESFYHLLDQLESRHPIEFHDREELYRNLFPNNGFSNCDFVIEITSDISKHQPNDLNDILYLLNGIEVSLDNTTAFSRNSRVRHIHNIVFDSFRLQSSLNLSFSKQKEIGDVNFLLAEERSFFVVNIFSPETTIDVCRDIISKFLVFSNNEELSASKQTICNSYSRLALMDAMFPEPHPRYQYTVHKGKYPQHLSFLCESYIFMNNHMKSYAGNVATVELGHLLCSKVEVGKLTANADGLRELVDKCVNVLELLEEHNAGFPTAKNLAERGKELSEELKPRRRQRIEH